jgi:hypothetical protein
MLDLANIQTADSTAKFNNIYTMESKPSKMQDIGQVTSAVQDGTVSEFKHEQVSKDIGSALFHEIEHFSAAELELKRGAVRRKVDLCLMPAVSAHVENSFDQY